VPPASRAKQNLRRHGIDCPKLGVAAGLIAAVSRRHAIKGAALAFCAAATEKTSVYSHLHKLLVFSQIVTILLVSMAIMVELFRALPMFTLEALQD
jgi:hypothetical protein